MDRFEVGMGVSVEVIEGKDKGSCREAVIINSEVENEE